MIADFLEFISNSRLEKIYLCIIQKMKIIQQKKQETNYI